MTKDSKVSIRLTKVKEWLIPADAESYKVLVKVGVPLVRMHMDMWPTIKVLLTKKKIKAEPVNFVDDIYDPFMERVGTEWKKGNFFDCTLTSKELVFETTKKTAYKKALARIPALEACLRRFFDRWGYAATFIMDEHRGKIQYRVQYKHSQDKLPVIPLETPPEAIPETKIQFGFTRLIFKFNDRNGQKTHRVAGAQGSEGRNVAVSKGPEIELRIEISQGGKWIPYRTTSCLYTEVSNVMPLMLGLAHIVNTDSTNMDHEYKD